MGKGNGEKSSLIAAETTSFNNIGVWISQKPQKG